MYYYVGERTAAIVGISSKHNTYKKEHIIVKDVFLVQLYFTTVLFILHLTFIANIDLMYVLKNKQNSSNLQIIIKQILSC